MKNYKITVGQKICVVAAPMFRHKDYPKPDKIYECEVIHVHEDDVYVKEVESNRVIGLKASLGLASWDGVITFYKAYTDANAYWDQKNRQDRLEKVKKKIKGLTYDLSVDDLEEVYETIKSVRDEL